MILQVSDWLITDLKTSLSSLKFLYRKTGDLMDVLLANLKESFSMTELIKSKIQVEISPDFPSRNSSKYPLS